MFMQIVHRILELTSEFVSVVEVVNQKDDGSPINCSCFVWSFFSIDFVLLIHSCLLSGCGCR